MSGTIIKVSGPLVVAEGLGDANVSDVVRVGPDRLIGEILNMTGEVPVFPAAANEEEEDHFILAAVPDLITPFMISIISAAASLL